MWCDEYFNNNQSFLGVLEITGDIQSRERVRYMTWVPGTVTPVLSIAAREIPRWRKKKQARSCWVWSHVHISLQRPGWLFQHAALWCMDHPREIPHWLCYPLPPVEDTSDGPISRTVFSSICPTESLRILSLCFWEKVAQSSGIQWEIYFLPVAENLFNHLHIIDHMLVQGCKVTW